MSQLVANCPRCHATNMTFDLLNQIAVGKQYDWQHILEAFCICRNCRKSTIFIVNQKEPIFEGLIKKGLSEYHSSVNQIVDVVRHVALQDHCAEKPPEYLPVEISSIFEEGAACLSIGCHNASATMFRLCLDLSTQSLLPEDAEGLNNRVRRSLGLRLGWLFDSKILPEALRELSTCIKDDGNDGAHEGTLTEEDARDILDFTFILLERIFTEPKRIELAAERRGARRQKA
jgi:hypothetical protein